MSAFRPPALHPQYQPPSYSVATFVLERFSKQSPAAQGGFAADLRTSLHLGQPLSGASGVTLQTSPAAASGQWSNQPYLQAPLPQSGLGPGLSGCDGGSIIQYRPSGFGQSVAETKEQSAWVHLSAPQHSVTLKIHRPSTSSCTRNSTIQAMSLAQPGPHPGTGLLDAREQELSLPELLIQSGQTTLECINLDMNSLRQTKLKGLVKGSMIGFRYSYFSPDSNVAETRKFQVKFQSQHDCGQCASILSLFIECRTASNNHSSGTGNENIEPHRSRLINRSQRTESRLGRGDGLSQNQDCGLFSQPSEAVISTLPQFGPQLTPALQPLVSTSRDCDFDQLLNMSDQDLQIAIDAILAHPTFAQLASKIQKVFRPSA